MRQLKYNIEIDCSGTECTRFEERGCWTGWGTLVAEGDTLEELLDNAGIDASDQDGGEIWCGPADEAWMQDLVVAAYLEARGYSLGHYETHGDYVARAIAAGVLVGPYEAAPGGAT